MGLDEIESYRELIKENIDYDILLKRYSYEKDLLDGYVELMLDQCRGQELTLMMRQSDRQENDVKTFAPDGDITREQMAAILYRYSQYKGKDVTAENELNFTDANEVSSYAVEAVQWACGAGIVNGTSSTHLSPQGNATRAQLAQMLKVYINM